MELKDLLEKYKELEQILRNKEKQIGDGSVLSYENTLNQDDLEKLKVCRIIRNYCQHHADYSKFMSIDGMTDFLDKQIREIEKQESLVKDIMDKTKAPTLKDSLEDILRYLIKTEANFCPVLNDKPKKNESVLVGVFTKENSLDLVLKNKLNTKISKLVDKKAEKELKNYKIVESKVQAKKLDSNKDYIVIDENNFKGII